VKIHLDSHFCSSTRVVLSTRRDRPSCGSASRHRTSAGGGADEAVVELDLKVDGVDAAVGMEADDVNVALTHVDLLLLRRHRKKGLGGGEWRRARRFSSMAAGVRLRTIFTVGEARRRIVCGMGLLIGGCFFPRL
jgi:hypothetical protein